MLINPLGMSSTLELFTGELPLSSFKCTGIPRLSSLSVTSNTQDNHLVNHINNVDNNKVKSMDNYNNNNDNKVQSNDQQRLNNDNQVRPLNDHDNNLLLLLWLLLFKMDRISLYWNVTPILVKRLFGWNFSYLLITNRLVYYFIT
jgi:hypothetical protein